MADVRPIAQLHWIVNRDAGLGHSQLAVVDHFVAQLRVLCRVERELVACARRVIRQVYSRCAIRVIGQVFELDLAFAAIRVQVLCPTQDPSILEGRWSVAPVFRKMGAK